jgi:hypothetical protein
MGTIHKESRQRIEVLRACQAISMEEWTCMARALQKLDTEFTGRCKTLSVPFREISDRQRILYTDCLGPSKSETVECAVLSSDPRCSTSRCSRRAAAPDLRGPAGGRLGGRSTGRPPVVA